jgi:hypothetical protein
VPGRVSPAAIKEALEAHPGASALYLTSPDYHGVLSDIGAAAALCREAGVPLLVDNAHGAHLFPFGLHPMALGADACVDSLHKTLPALTGAALVHLSDPDMGRTALERMGMFGSTSPSFLILLSMDRLLPKLESELPDRLNALAAEVAGFAAQSAGQGLWGTAGLCDPCRLCLCHARLRWEGKFLRGPAAGPGIEPEYLSESHCVLLPGIHGRRWPPYPID